MIRPLRCERHGTAFAIVNPKGERVALLPQTHRIEAEGLVRAYNVYEELVAALGAYVALDESPPLPGDLELRGITRSVARAALAKARA